MKCFSFSSLCAFSNAETFKTIVDADIVDVENFVKCDLLEYFQTNHKGDENGDDDVIDNAVFTEEDKLHFFGIYASNPSKFRFLLGDRKLIHALVQYINRIEADKSNLDDFLLMDGGGKVKFSWKGALFSSIGMYFGENTKQQAKKVIKSNSSEQLKRDLYNKVKRFLDSYSTETKTVSKNFEENMIFISMSENDIKAEVRCILCVKSGITKNISVFRQSHRTSSCWILSNLKKHFDRHPRINNAVTENEEEPTTPTAHMSSSEGNAESERFSQYVDTLFTQLKVQALKMKNAVHRSNEMTESMSFNIDEEVSGHVFISNIAADGNCMFGALAHQLFYVKLNSKQHDELTKKLREQVVAHIKENFASYAQIIKGRILERGTQAMEMDKECTFFVNYVLPKTGMWGGFESLKAITSIYGVNIMVFSENGDSYFALPDGFNINYERTVFIAFRVTNNQKRDHYDSVVEIEAEIIEECSTNLIKKQMQKCSQHGFGDSIIVLNDTL